MRRKCVSLLLMMCSICMLLSGCGQPFLTTKKDNISIKVGVTLYDQYDVFLSQLMVAFNNYASLLSSETGVTINIEVYNASGTQSAQNTQVETMIQDGCSVICVNLVDRTDTTKIIDAAQRSNVPLIFFNRELVEEDLERWDRLYYVGATVDESGIIQGEQIVEYIEQHKEIDQNGDGIIQYVVLEGEAGHQDAITRTAYSVEEIEDAGISLEKVDNTIANWNRDQAKTKITQLIENGENVELVISNNDAMALGAIDAYEKEKVSRSKWPAIFGIDGVEEGLEAVQEGTMQATVYNDKEGQAKAMANLAYNLAMNKSLSGLNLENGKYIRLSYTGVTSDNVEDYLKD